MTDVEIGSFWQRFWLTVTHIPDAAPITSALRLQLLLLINKSAYWPEVIQFLTVGLASTAHHLCGNYELQHLDGYQACLFPSVKAADVLSFTDQMFACCVLNIFGTFGPDVCNYSFLRVAPFLYVGINASIAYYDINDANRYSLFAFVAMLFCLCIRFAMLNKQGNLSRFYDYHLNGVNIVVGTMIMMLAYTSKSFGDMFVYYTIGHGIWQTLSLGPGMSLWVEATDMGRSLFCWRRKKKNGKYYDESIDESGFNEPPEICKKEESKGLIDKVDTKQKGNSIELHRTGMTSHTESTTYTSSNESTSHDPNAPYEIVISENEHFPSNESNDHGFDSNSSSQWRS